MERTQASPRASRPTGASKTSVPTIAVSSAPGRRAGRKAISASPGTDVGARSAWRLAIITAAVLAGAVPLLAQLPFAATYDDDRQVRLEGPITRIEWSNPRAYLFVDVRDAQGLVGNWAVEIGNPLDLERDGWKRTAVRIGDVVTVEGVPARGVARRAFARAVTMTRTAASVFASLARWAGAAWAARGPEGILGRRKRESAGRGKCRQSPDDRRRRAAESRRCGSRGAVPAMVEGGVSVPAANDAQGRPGGAVPAARRSAAAPHAARVPVRRAASARSHPGP